MDEDAIGPLWNLDENRVGLAFSGVVLEQAGAEASGLYANVVIDGGVVGVSIEDVDGDAVLLNRVAGVGNGVMNDIAEEELTTMRSTEGARAEDSVELRPLRTIVGQRSERKTGTACRR